MLTQQTSGKWTLDSGTGSSAEVVQPTEAPTPTPEEPGFEAVFAIAGFSAVVYLVQRRKR